MDSAELTLVIHSARDLNDVKNFGTMDPPYAKVWIAGCGHESNKVRTPMSVKGGCYPKWEYTIKFNFVSVKRDYSLFIKIKHDGKIIDRDIGQVEVPFAKLLAPNASSGKGTYPLSLTCSKKKGDIIFSHEFSRLVVNEDDGRCPISNVTDPGGLRKRDKAQRLVVKVANGGMEVAQFAGQLAGQLAVGIVLSTGPIR